MFSESGGLDGLYRCHRVALLAQARRLTRSDADANDLVQDTFERAHRSLATFQAGTNGHRWLATIMTRLFIDRWRQVRRRPLETPIHELEVPAPPPDPEPSWRAVTREDLDAALATLPPQSRTLVERHALSGTSYSTLAEELGLRAATVGTRLFRTRGKLRTALLDRTLAA